MVAGVIMAIFLSSLFALNGSSLAAIRNAKESTYASQVLQQRIESMRIANWHNVTDANWLKSNLLNQDAPGENVLKSASETLSLVPYEGTNTNETKLTRTGGVASIVSQNPTMLTENAAKIVWTINYRGAPNNRAYSRQIVAILAKGGVAR
jgi:Tfp pilus assembly protein PilV